MKLPSRERGCVDKMKIKNSEKAISKARRLKTIHTKEYGVYQCPYCARYHLTTKLENSKKYIDLIYRTDV